MPDYDFVDVVILSAIVGFLTSIPVFLSGWAIGSSVLTNIGLVVGVPSLIFLLALAATRLLPDR